MAPVKVGTRLTLVLLLAVTPVIAVHTYLSVQRATNASIADLKREIRASVRALVPAVDNDLRERQWDQILNELQRMSVNETRVALFTADGNPWYIPLAFPTELMPTADDFRRADAERFAEFERTIADRSWFCRLVPLTVNGELAGRLLVAQDWTNISEDLRARRMTSIGVAMLVMALIAVIIPLAVRRYISDPLSELSRRVTRFSADGARPPEGDEVELLTEEFRRLAQQLTQAGADLTERHRRELELERRLQRADRLATIGTLASGLAHEIGTPMGVIRARAEYLLHSKPPAPKAREGLEIIINQIDRITRIVRMLLNYARGNEPIRAANDIRRIVQHALSLVETEAVRRNVRLTAELGEEPLTVDCDADQLQQVFVNLAVNALDAMGETGGTLQVLASAEGVNGIRRARVTFADTGPGVAPQDRSRVFDPFYTTKEPGKGTGMGLAVSQSIMRDHGGEITLESDTDGTRFFVTMPMAAEQTAPRQAGAPRRGAEGVA
ncbi:MAG TPA: HAMP domain-containing sensor histidine kinase [Candidatus Binataceae bacterium]|jgi:signal transduction histidine kinase|nr:HAMP domain-containing sensor histidine kinase [Candidatus Binataceae bacterium]